MTHVSHDKMLLLLPVEVFSHTSVAHSGDQIYLHFGGCVLYNSLVEFREDSG